MARIVQLVEHQYVTSTNNTKHFLIWDSQHLVRSQQLSPAHSFDVSVLRDDLRYGDRSPHSHCGIDLNTHLAAAVGKIFGAHLIGTAEHELDVHIADDLSPKIIGIAILQLTE